LFEAILDAGASANIKPVGLGARDTLRSKRACPSTVTNSNRNSSPLEAGLSPFVKLGRPFIGAPALEVQHRDGIRKKLIGLRTDDGKMIARQGYRSSAMVSSRAW